MEFKRGRAAPPIFRGFFAETPRGQYFGRRWKILIPFGGTLRGTPGRLCYTAGSDPTVSSPPSDPPRVLHLSQTPPSPRRPPTLGVPVAPRRAATATPSLLPSPRASRANHLTPKPPDHPRALYPLPSTAPLCEPLVNLLAPL